jgi:toxin FitB
VSGFLLDTNCISELIRVRPEPRVVEWLAAADEEMLYLSVLTLGEIRKGIASLPKSRKQAPLTTWLEVDVQTRFSGRILTVDTAVAQYGACSRLRQSAMERHYPSETDCWRRPLFITTSPSFRETRPTS